MSIIIIIIIIAVLQSSAELRVSDIIINNKAGLTIPIVQLCNVVIIFFQEGWLSVNQAVAGQTTEREGASSGLPHICRPVLRRAYEINQRRQVCVSTKGDDDIFFRGPTLCKLVVIDSM